MMCYDLIMGWGYRKTHSNKYLYILIFIYILIYSFLIFTKNYNWITYFLTGVSFLLFLAVIYVSQHILQILSQISLFILKQTAIYRIIRILKLDKFIINPASRNKIIKIYKDKVVRDIAKDSLYIARDYIHEKRVKLEQNNSDPSRPRI